MFSSHIIVFLILNLVFASAVGKPIDPEQIPEPLKPWVDWVLYDQQQSICPFLYNNIKQRRCSWPTRVDLKLDDRQGRFSNQWLIYLDSWVVLPGDTRHWPADVKVGGIPAVVVERQGKPVVHLGPGEHRIEGVFRWRQLPENLKIPQDSGLIALKVNGKKVDFPVLNQRGQLWLQGGAKSLHGRRKIQDTLDVQVFRRIIDDIPLRVITRIELKVAGKQRLVSLPNVLLEDFIPVEISSSLAARLEPDGRLQVQIRPGRWAIDITARSPRRLQQLTAHQSAEPWSAFEVWVFEARPGYRLVEIQGLTSIDPSQTLLPKKWKQFPAYRIKAREQMKFKVIRRGDPDPQPDKLSLQRDLWLDFQGAGYTIRDRINGEMTREWRLNANAEINLGQVIIDGQPQLITQQESSSAEGVEVRRGALDLSADSRFEGEISALNAVGWDQDFQNVRATLHLPPGWRLFAATGVDNVPNTWLFRWTLLDLFLVLIASLAVARLWNWRSGFLALATLAIIWHEPGAPRFVWLNILATVALLRVLPPGKVQLLTKFYRNAALLTLIVMGVLFSISQVRIALYPQLERPRQALSRAPVSVPVSSAEFAEDSVQGLGASTSKMARATGAAPLKSAVPKYRARIDPKATIQTGPGLPQWSWNSVTLSWNGPVDRQQEIGLILLSPRMLFVIKIFQVMLLWLLFLLLIGFAKMLPFGRGPSTGGVAACLMAISTLWVFCGDA